MAGGDKIYRDRTGKIKSIKKMGWHLYASSYEKKHSIAEARTKLGDKVNTAGKLYSFRTHGNIAFADLKDETGKIQIFFKKDVLGDKFYKSLKYLDIGDFIGVEGEVVKTTAGEISITPSKYTFLTKSLRPLPHEWYGLKNVETRYRKRYLDLLMNREVKQIFLARSKIVSLLREYLDKRGFVEIETPILQPIYGGASAKPFKTHHNALDSDFYLRIADELYLKRLIVGGFERVYEIGKDFRNEGLSRAHNPEFTQIEFYWAYADYGALMSFTEEYLCWVIEKVKGTLEIEYQGKKYSFKKPWERATYRDLMNRFLKIDINKVTSEKDLQRIVKERKLLKEQVVGYGLLLDKLYKKHIRPKLEGPLFLIDHPIEQKPLAKRKEDDPTKAASFQLLVAGEELINAFNELNDPMDQAKRWKEEMDLASRGAEDSQTMDRDYIEALEYGMPPTAGWGLGVDRFVAFLTDQHTLKDVIMFPTLKPEAVNKE